jgi:lysophospholipase L1-like esterase
MKKIGLILIIVTSILMWKCKETQDMDWPNLKRYQEKNSNLSLVQENEQRVVLMGNSITEAWSWVHPEFFENKLYVNRGISGQTTPQMLIRFRQDVVELNPTVVVILAGINDIAGNTGPSTLEMILNNIKSMIEIAQANNIKVVLCSVLPANRFNWQPKKQPADDVIQLNKMIKAYADENTIPYVDYYSAMVDDEKGLRIELGEDGVHPNAEGYKIMAPILEEILSTVLK